MTTKTEEASIRARLSAASRGPWMVRKHPSRDALTIYAPKGGGYVIHPDLGYVNDDADAEFIAGAREDIEHLLVEIDRLRVEALSSFAEGCLATAHSPAPVETQEKGDHRG